MGSKQRKGQAQIYLRDWLLTPRSQTEDGSKILNLHHIYDLALLEELIKYNDKGNFDRVSALLVGMFYLVHMFNRDVKSTQAVEEDAEDFWDREWFS